MIHFCWYSLQATDLLTGVKAVNKTDVVTLLSTFGSIADVMAATPGELALCPGFGEQKVRSVAPCLVIVVELSCTFAISRFFPLVADIWFVL